MKYIVFGNKGQLGKEISNLLESKNIEFSGYDLPEYDICNFILMSQLISTQVPTVVINCTGYNNVDLAELNFEEAYKTNAAGVKNLATICKRENIKLIHYSTDYVFDGLRKVAGIYSEDEEEKPLNAYGITKLQGEKAILETNSDALILRTSWLYGDGESNFVYKILKLAETQKHLRIINDEFSVPTSTKLLANITLKAINNNLSGLYNVVNSGYASRYEWAKLLFELLKNDTVVNGITINSSIINTIIYPISSKEFVTVAKRPPFSALNNNKISKELQIEIPHWKTEFIDYMKRINSQKTHLSKFKRLRNETGITEY